MYIATPTAFAGGERCLYRPLDLAALNVVKINFKVDRYRTSGTYSQGMEAAPPEYKTAPLKVITLENFVAVIDL